MRLNCLILQRESNDNYLYRLEYVQCHCCAAVLSTFEAMLSGRKYTKDMNPSHSLILQAYHAHNGEGNFLMAYRRWPCCAVTNV